MINLRSHIEPNQQQIVVIKLIRERSEIIVTNAQVLKPEVSI